MALTLLVSTHVPSCPELFVRMLQAGKVDFGGNSVGRTQQVVLSYSTHHAVVLFSFPVLPVEVVASDGFCHGSRLTILYMDDCCAVLCGAVLCGAVLGCAALLTKCILYLQFYMLCILLCMRSCC